MGTLKIELDLPEFKDKLEVSIVVKKDGTIVPPSIVKDEGMKDNDIVIPPTYPRNPLIRDPYPGENKLEIRDPIPGEPGYIGITCNDDLNKSINNSSGIVDSMISGTW